MRKAAKTLLLLCLAILVLMNTALADTLAMRRESAEAVFGSFSGLRVPAGAVRTDEETGERYVWTVTAMQLERRSAEILYEGEDYVILRRAAESGALRQGDTVVVGCTRERLWDDPRRFAGKRQNRRADMSINENVQAVRERIEDAARGRKVWLVAATKMNGAEAVREDIAAGVDACGENRVQEFVEKDALGAYAGAPKHFIGHLQRNKVNKLVGAVDLIQSVDSAELLELIDRRARALGITQDILIEVSIAGEAQKSGISPEQLPALLEKASAMEALQVRGLMCVPPILEAEGSNRRYFAAMRQLFIDNGGKKYDNVTMDFLSMGMTDDYPEAIAEGANMVRIGTGIFGARPYHTRSAEA